MANPTANLTTQPLVQTALLKGQIQQQLDNIQPGRFEVHLDLPFLSESGRFFRKSGRYSEMPSDTTVIRPASSIAVVDRSRPQPIVRWVIDFVNGDVAGSCFQVSRSLSHFYASLGIADCWILGMPQVELRVYSSLSDSPLGDIAPNKTSPVASAESEQLFNYQQVQFYSVGQKISPTSIPNIALRVQEPLPLYFLTRTAKGQRTDVTSALPLQICSDDL